jgi:D-xylose 1-dehydrogenase
VPKYPDLEGKIVLLTGGANGIGAATVRAFAAQGAKVEFCDLDAQTGRVLESEAPSSRFTRADLANERQVIRWIEGAAKRHQRLDILVNNAAIDPRIPLEALTVEKWDRLFAINLRALYLTAREAVPHMAKTSKGSIVNFSSITFHTAPPNLSAYVGTKGGVIAATRSLARELGPKSIRVNTVSPGWIMTERQLREFVDAKTKRLIKSAQCIPELLQPEDIAEVVLFLASDASRAITGQEILADRGWAHS